MGIGIYIGNSIGNSKSGYWTPLNFDYQAKIIDLFAGHILGLWPLQEASGTNVTDIVNSNLAHYEGSISYHQAGINKFYSTKLGALNLSSAGFISGFNAAEGYASFWIGGATAASWTTSDKTLLYFMTDASNRFIFRIYSDGASQTYLSFIYIAGGTNINTFTTTLDGTRLWNVGIRWSKTNDAIDIFINGIKQKTVTGLGTWVGDLPSGQIYVGADAFGGNNFSGRFSHSLVLDYAPSDAVILSSIQPGGIICFEGDSRSNSKLWCGAVANSINALSVYGAGLFGVADTAVSGNLTTSITARAADTNTRIIAGKNNVLVYWAGVNDASDGRSAAQIYATTKAYLIAARIAGWNKIVLCTEIDAQDAVSNAGGWHTTIQPALNALIIADHSFADVIADLGARAELQNAADTTYFTADKIHPNNTGFGIVATVVGAALATLNIT